jgi:fructose-1,6-bisphosphatase/inositol monophosphatase family enzyme
MEQSGIYDLMEIACLDATRLLLSELQEGKDLQVERKADHTLVTRLDLLSQKTIVTRLGSICKVASEEDAATHSRVMEDGFCITVDPLDGTSACKRFGAVRGGQVGFGPLLGLFRDRKLQASCYYNVPTKTFFAAKLGSGCTRSKVNPLEGQRAPLWRDREILKVDAANITFKDAGVLFYPGVNGEMRVLEQLRRQENIEVAYRFGGFANDCSRLAQGFEQMGIQFICKPWDLPAALFPVEAGLTAQFPESAKFDRWQSLGEYEVRAENPLLICPAHLGGGLREIAQAAMGAS